MNTIFSLILAVICIAYFIKQYHLYKQGWGIKIKLSGGTHGGEKPNASTNEQINLLIESVLILLFGIALLAFNVLSWIY